MTLVLHTVICSTRPGRVGPAVARWFHAYAQQEGSFEAQLVDLASFHLPVFDEPNHPRLRRYEREHTNRWSASVNAADAFAFVTPEYNYCPPPSFINAVTFLSQEWAYKPCAFVSYGGLSGGVRAVQVAKQLVTTLKMMPIPEAVAVPGVASMLSADKAAFTPSDLVITSAGQTLAELAKWAGALQPLRNRPG